MASEFLFVVMNYFFPFPLFVVGMASGVGKCVITLGVLCLALFIIFGVEMASIYLILYGLPSVLLVRQALSRTVHPDLSTSWPSFGKVLEMMIALGLISCAFLSFYFSPDNIRILQQTLQENNNFQEFFPAFDPAQLETFFLFLPGTIVLGWCFLLLGNEVLAQKLLSSCNYNIRPDFHLRDISCPRWILYLFLTSSVGGWLLSGTMLGFIAKNCALISGMGVFLNGLSLIHQVIKTSRYSGRLFFFFYLFFFLSVWLVLVIIGFGLAETFLKLKKRISLSQKI